MPILSPTVAANVLRCDPADPRMLDLLPQLDAYLKRATGRDWSQDNPPHELAVSAATMLLVNWYENPARVGSQITESPLQFGLTNVLIILESEALKYRKFQFAGLSGAGSLALPGAALGDEIISLTGVYGASGDQSGKFESVISSDGALLQTSADDLSGNRYVVILKSPADDVLP